MLRTGSRLEELTVRQQILFDLLRLADTLGVKFAYPTQSLHIENWPGSQVDPVGARAFLSGQ